MLCCCSNVQIILMSSIPSVITLWWSQTKERFGLLHSLHIGETDLRPEVIINGMLFSSKSHRRWTWNHRTARSFRTLSQHSSLRNICNKKWQSLDQSAEQRAGSWSTEGHIQYICMLFLFHPPNGSNVIYLYFEVIFIWFTTNWIVTRNIAFI